MTAFGKILAFINLGFSIVVGVLGILVYITRVNYSDALKKYEDRYSVLLASRDALAAEFSRVRSEADTKVAAAKAEAQNVASELQKKLDELTVVRSETADQKKELATKQGELDAANSEVKRRDTEAKEVKEQLSKETKARLDLVSESNKLREETTSARIEKDSVQKENERLVAQLSDMAKELERSKSQGGSGSSVAGKPKNPAPDGVEGLVKGTSSQGLLTVSIGSDHGLQEGHTLEVFRLSNIQGQSRYLGTLRVIKVTPTEAVCQPVKPLTEKPQNGDRVASKILGS